MPIYFKYARRRTIQCNNISHGGFILVILVQLNMLMKFGPNVACMDETHRTDGYNITPKSILVIDEFREGIPVVWLVSNG